MLHDMCACACEYTDVLLASTAPAVIHGELGVEEVHLFSKRQTAQSFVLDLSCGVNGNILIFASVYN